MAINQLFSPLYKDKFNYNKIKGTNRGQIFDLELNLPKKNLFKKPPS